jgi:hypothetical protein
MRDLQMIYYGRRGVMLVSKLDLLIKAESLFNGGVVAKGFIAQPVDLIPSYVGQRVTHMEYS